MSAVADVATPRQSRLESLDILRFVAALAVTLYHFTFRGWAHDGLNPLPFPWMGSVAKYGYLGVDAFFVISGFVILMTAMRQGPGGFVTSRIVRLFPVYWVCVALAFVSFSTPAGEQGQADWMAFAVNLTMFQEFLGVGNLDGVYWTLTIELRFYLLILLLMLARQTRRIETALWVWITVLLLRDRQLIALPAWLDAALIQQWAHYFIAGAVFYLVRERGLNASRGALLALCIARALQHAYWFMLLKVRLTNVPMEMVVVGSALMLVFGLFALIASGRLDAFRWRWAATAGALTYPLYLVHQPVANLLLYSRLSARWSVLQLVAVLLISLIVAWTVHRAFERPVAAWLKERLAQRRPRPFTAMG